MQDDVLRETRSPRHILEGGLMAEVNTAVTEAEERLLESEHYAREMRPGPVMLHYTDRSEVCEACGNWNEDPEACQDCQFP